MVRLVVLVVVTSVVGSYATTNDRAFPIKQSTQLGQAGSATVVWSGSNVGDVYSLSPDGRTAAYIDRSQQGSVAIRDLTTGTNRIIARAQTAPVVMMTGLRPSLTEAAGEVVFSADGSQVAYSWAKYRDDVYELRVADVRDGGNMRVVATTAPGALIKLHDWSKDGRWFAVESRSSGVSPTVDFLIVAVADGGSRVIKTVETQPGISRMSFSPDGRYIAYDRPPNRNATQYDVFLLTVDTSAERPAVASSADDFVAGWSSDGRAVLFTSEEGSTVSLRSQPIVNGSPDGTARTLRADIGGRPVGINGAGQLLISVVSDPMTIYGAEVSRETGGLRGTPERLSPRRWAASWAPAFSDDGRRLAFLSRSAIGAGAIGGGPGVSLSVKSVDTGQIMTVPLKLLQVVSLDWSPDGKTLVTGATDYQGRFGVHLIDAASGTTTPLAIYTDGLRFTGSQWAATRQIYYNRTPQGVLAAKTHTIIERNIDTGEERAFLDWSQVRTTSGSPLETIRNVQVSPDHQWVVGLGTVSGSEGSLWLVSVKDKSARALPLELESGPFPISNDFTWTPDGRAILVNLRHGTGREARRSLWFVPVDGSKAVRLAIDLPIQDGASDVHPDGRRIAFVSGSSGTREIQLIQGFLPSSGR